MRTFFPYIFFALFAGLWIFAFFYFDNNKNSNKNGEEEYTSSSLSVQEDFVFITINNATVRAEVADTEQKRTKGLGAREYIGENEGMLFVFPKLDAHGFWMKDMRFALDFIWVDEQFRVADIAKNVSPETFPQIFRPATPVRYVLEVSAGFADIHNVKKGDSVIIK